MTYVTATRVEKKPRAPQTKPTRTEGLTYHNWGNETVPFIRSYADARLHFDTVFKAQKPFKDTSLWPVGKRSLRNRAMQETHDGGIMFTYYGDHVCTYHADGTVTAQAFPVMRHGDFDRTVMPDGVWQDQFNRTGSCLILGTHSDDKETRYFWNEMRKEPESLTVVRARNPVHLHLVDKRWLPVDPEALKPFEWRSLDRSKALKVSKAAGLRDLVAVIKACNALEGEMPAFVGQYSYRGHGYETDYAQALALVEDGKFLEATAYLRRIDGNTKWDQTTQTYSTVGGGQIVSTEFERLRTMLYLREGVVVGHSAKVVNWTQHVAIETALKRFGRS